MLDAEIDGDVDELQEGNWGRAVGSLLLRSE